MGYWPVAAGLPFFAAVEKGYFKEAGLDVEPLKFAGAQQVMEAMLAGRSDGSANGTGSANLAIGEIAQPGLFKIFCTNPTNVKFVLDEFLVAKDSPIKTLAELKGKRVASGPGIQNVTLAKVMLERAGELTRCAATTDDGRDIFTRQSQPFVTWCGGSLLLRTEYLHYAFGTQNFVTSATFSDGSSAAFTTPGSVDVVRAGLSWKFP